MRPIPSNWAQGSPMSVEDIAKDASIYDYNPVVPLKYWLRSAASLAKEAEIYKHEGNVEQAYLLLFRHTHFILTKLVDHPDAQEKTGKQALSLATKEAQRNLAKLETLRPKIKKRYEQHRNILQERSARRSERELQAEALKDTISSTSSHFDQNQATPTQTPTEPLDAGEHADFAVQLAQTELPRRVAARKATRLAGVAEDEERRRRRGGVWDSSTTHQDSAQERDDLSQRLQDIGARINNDRGQRTAGQTHRQRLPNRSALQSYKYPSIPDKQQQHDTPKLAQTHHFLPPTEPEPSHAPAIPPKDEITLPPQNPSTRLTPPALPSKTPLQPSKPVQRPQEPSVPSPRPPSTPPDTASSSKPYTFAPSAYLENGTPLRTVFLPKTLRQKFITFASPNTSRNLETCGVLAGSLLSNALFISHLIIPDQVSTSDTCETVNESDLFDFVDSEDLLVLGWIHTHPTQSCFMSSRDLHTHSGYQVMMAESIAIVCAPSIQDEGRSWGCFRLTDPPGMKTILNCKKEGVFHPHDGFTGDGINGTGEGGLYTDASRPGHVVEARGLEFNVVDLRPGK